MQQAKLVITNEVGLHARPATQFVRTSNQFKSDIQVKYGSKKANAKSILQVLSLGVEKDGEIDLYELIIVSNTVIYLNGEQFAIQ